MKDQPIYQLPEEEDEEMEPLYEIDDEDDEDINSEENDSGTEIKKFSPFSLLFKIMIGPKDGWRALKRSKISTDAFGASCFYPVLALTAISETAALFFEANKTVQDIVVDGLSTFITYFFGYFMAILLCGIVLPKNCRDIAHSQFGKLFIMVGMTTLALFHILLNILPMFDPVLVFLPIWTIFITVRGVHILRVPKDKETSVAGLLSLLIIACPLFCNWLIGEIL